MKRLRRKKITTFSLLLILIIGLIITPQQNVLADSNQGTGLIESKFGDYTTGSGSWTPTDGVFIEEDYFGYWQGYNSHLYVHYTTNGEVAYHNDFSDGTGRAMDSDGHNIYFTTATDPAPLYKLNTTTWTYTSVDLSVSGQGAALCYYDGKIYVGTKTGNFEVFNKDTLQSLDTYTPGGPNNMPDLYVDDDYLYYHTYGNTLYKVNLETSSTTSTTIGTKLSSISGNGHNLVLSDTSSQYHIVNKTTLDTVYTKTGIGETWSTAADPLGLYFYITDRDGYIRVWNDTAEQEEQTYSLGWSDLTNGMKVSAESQKLILRDNSQKATVLNLEGYIGPSPPVPEKSTLMLFSIGLIMVISYIIYKKRKKVHM